MSDAGSQARAEDTSSSPDLRPPQQVGQISPPCARSGIRAVCGDRARGGGAHPPWRP